MIHILLVIIYLAFISLGLPDSLLGSAWPVMHMEFSVPISYAGAVSMMIAAGTIISSLLSDRLTRKLGTGRVTAISVGMTAAAGRTVFHWHHHRTCYQRLCHLQIQRLADGPHRTRHYACGHHNHALTHQQDIGNDRYRRHRCWLWLLPRPESCPPRSHRGHPVRITLPLKTYS